MPFDRSRWMRDRHSHPRIGPAYQATIPSLEGGPYPRIPLNWLGEAAAAEAEAAATEAAAAPGQGKTPGRSRLGSASHKQQNAASQASRPVTRKMRATAARNAKPTSELQPQQPWKQAPAEDMAFSASLLADAARETKELRAGLSGAMFSAVSLGSTAVGSDTAAGEAAKGDATAQATTSFYGGLISSLPNTATEAAKAAAETAADLLTAEEATGGIAEGGLTVEIPRVFGPRGTAATATPASEMAAAADYGATLTTTDDAAAAEAAAVAAAAGNAAAAEGDAAVQSLGDAFVAAHEGAGRASEKHNLNVLEDSSQKKQRS